MSLRQRLAYAGRVGHELLEHTADVGLRAWGPTVEAAAADAVLGLAELAGARVPGPGRPSSVRGEAADDGARLVALLNEVLFVLETEPVAIAGARVRREGEALVGELEVVEGERPAEGIGVKAATYHQLAVEEGPDGAEVRVYLDV